MNKRKYLLGLLSLIVMMTISSIPVLATNEDVQETELVEVTDEVAIEMANRFGEAVSSDIALTASNPIKFYDTSGQAIGFIVDYFYNDTPYGYVIFDNTDESLISEYAIAENAKNPYEIILEESDISPYARSGNKIYKTDPFAYCVPDSPAGAAINNYGEQVPLSIIEDSASTQRSGKKPGSWDDVFLEIETVYEDYNMLSSNNLEEFHAVSEATVEAKTGRYACAISALYACGEIYGTANYYNLKNDYLSLWDYTSTTTTHEDRGISYGSTLIKNIGPGFVSFCSSKGIKVSQETTSNPDIAFFRIAIDVSNPAVFSCGIISKTGDRVGHSMAVQGYAQLQRKNSTSKVNTLMVFDGWNEKLRFLNLNYGKYTDTAGIAFRR